MIIDIPASEIQNCYGDCIACALCSWCHGGEREKIIDKLPDKWTDEDCEKLDGRIMSND